MPYEIKHHTRLATQQAPPELLAVNPSASLYYFTSHGVDFLEHRLGKSPVIEDGEFILAESGAIVGASQPSLPWLFIKINIEASRIHHRQIWQSEG